jgi:hypothetical protein
MCAWQSMATQPQPGAQLGITMYVEGFDSPMQVLSGYDGIDRRNRNANVLQTGGPV